MGPRAFLGRLRNLRQRLPVFLSPVGRSFAPRHVFLTLNSACNLRCRMCDVGRCDEATPFARNLAGRPGEDLPLEDLIRFLDEIAPHAPSVAAVATEPLLYPRLGELARECAKRGMPLHVTTNGWLLEDKAHELVRAGVGSVAVSLDALGAAHDAIRGRAGAFRRAIAGLHRLLESRTRERRSITVSVSCTITPQTYRALPSFHAYLARLPLSNVTYSHLNFITPRMAERHNAVAPVTLAVTPSSVSGECDPAAIDPEALHEAITRVRAADGPPRLFVPDLRTPGAIRRYYHEPERVVARSRCLVPWHSIQITATGEVVPLARCFHVVLGDIRRQSFTEIWDGEPYRRFRRGLRAVGMYPACTRCCGVL